MIIAGVLVAIPVVALLAAFDFWHCRARDDDPRASMPTLHETP